MKAPRTLALVALCLVALAATTAFADRLDASISLGQTATATVPGSGGVTTVGFLVTEGTARKLACTVKRGKGSALQPDVKLIAPDGTVFVVAANGGSVKTSATSWSAKIPDIPQSGLWRIEVRGAAGTSGGCTVNVKGKDAFKVSGTVTIPVNGKQDVVVVAGDNAAITVSASRAGSGIVPQLTILDPNGAVVGTPFAASDKTGKLSVKSYRLPLFGRYTLRFSGGAGTGGGMNYSVSGGLAKISGTLPTADAGEATETEPGLVTTLDGTASRPASGQALTYRWAQVSGPAVALSGTSTSKPTFTAPTSDAAIAFQLSVSENGALSRAATLDVTVARRPLADAGRSQAVLSAAPVTLDGTKCIDRRGSGLRYGWRQVPGDDATVTLTGADSASPTFTAPPGNHTLHFGLTVDDGNARSFEDVVVVEVGTANTAVADAGREQYVPRMATVTLSGLASRNASGVLDTGLLWTQTGGPAVALAGATTPWPSFTSPRTQADLEFQLAVNGVAATADRVSVHVRPLESNLPAPTKADGPLNAPSGTVQLSAVATTDPNGDALTYRWAQVSGSAVPVTNPTSAGASTAIAAGNGLYLFGVQSNDGLQYGAPDVVSVRNSSYAGLPIAIAGDNRTANPGATLTLDGSGSTRTDALATPLTYQWTQVLGQDWFNVATSLVPFDATAAKPSLALPLDVSSLTPTRTIVLQLTVNDGAGTSRPDFISITFQSLPLNGKPAVTANVSSTNPIVGTTINLTATASDRDNDPLTFKWTQTSGPTVTLAPNSTSLAVSFVAPDVSAPIGFRFVANDGFEDGTALTPLVNVDRKPVANIVVTPTNGAPGTQVTMDGSSSADPEANPLTYAWTQTSGTTVAIANPAAPVISFSAPSGAVGFRLVVNDGRQPSDPRTAAFSASPPPSVSPTASRTSAAYGATVALSANPGAGGPFTFAWRQINPSGTDPVVTLSSASAQNPTFAVPLPTTLPFGTAPSATFGVIASDAIQSSPERTVLVTFFASLNDLAQTSSANTIMGIVTSKCVSCHVNTSNYCPVGSAGNAAGYGMQTKTAFLNNTRGAANCSGSAKTRAPSATTPPTLGASATNSYLWDRLKPGGATPRMPTSGSLSLLELNLFQDWIDQGVQDN